MAASSPPADGTGTGEAEIQTIPRSAAAFEIAENGLKQPGPRPKTADNDFQESRRWAKDNAEWIGDEKVDIQRTLSDRRASEDLLRCDLPRESYSAATVYTNKFVDRPKPSRNHSQALTFFDLSAIIEI
jgi:hypothetical protein